MGKCLVPHINILNELFKDTEVVPLEDHPYKNGTKQVTLSEKEQYSVIIQGLPDENSVIVLKIDNFPAPSKIFKGSKGECKRADFVIITNGDKRVILFIEMKAKSTTEKAEHIVKQLKGAQCVMKYIEEIGKLFWNPDFLNDFEYRFIALMDININKRGTRHSSAQKIHDTPETVLKIKAPQHLQFNQLIGKP